MSNTKTKPPTLEVTLRDCSGAIQFHTGHMEERIANLQQELLPTQLKVGLYCLRAHEAFAIQSPASRGAMKGKAKKLPHAGELSTPPSFEGWLRENHPQIKSGTAYRWMTAFKGLGLESTATEKQVDSTLAKLRESFPVSLKSLCDAAPETVDPPKLAPPKLQQGEFEFLRQNLSAFREESENICRLKDQLDAHPEFKRVATARAYSILFELTGSHWTPSDEAHELASVDPDSITI